MKMAEICKSNSRANVMQVSRLTLNTDMLLALSIMGEGRVDYCCTAYDPEKEDAALTAFEAQVINSFQDLRVQESFFTLISKFVEELCSSHIESTGDVLLTGGGRQEWNSSREIGL
jgi:hypothetical protein